MSPTKSSRVRSPRTEPKLVYLVRHGESQGQAAKRHGMDRRRDPRLLDAGLTKIGVDQAVAIPEKMGREAHENVQLVVSSPLTRALHTALLGFSTKPILIHYDLAELGSKVPENKPRNMKSVMKDLSDVVLGPIDYVSLQPDLWPPKANYNSRETKTKRVRAAFSWLYEQREEDVLAVVCHFGIIQAALGFALSPQNAEPISCHLYESGQLKIIPQNETCTRTN